MPLFAAQAFFLFFGLAAEPGQRLPRVAAQVCVPQLRSTPKDVMSLIDLPSFPEQPALPASIRRFLREADRRIDHFCHERVLPAFVPSDSAAAYLALRALAASGLLAGHWFCEWGSGFGVTACLAALLEFDAWGIEIEGELVDGARRLAGDFDLPVEFVCGSFIPAGDDVFAEAAAACAWLTDTAGGGHEEIGLAPEEFDVIFAYPWPDEEPLTAALFEQYGREGAVLMTYEEAGGLRLRQKAAAGRSGVGCYRRPGPRRKRKWFS
jgi:hypothetical protein